MLGTPSESRLNRRLKVRGLNAIQSEWFHATNGVKTATDGQGLDSRWGERFFYFDCVNMCLLPTIGTERGSLLTNDKLISSGERDTSTHHALSGWGLECRGALGRKISAAVWLQRLPVLEEGLGLHALPSSLLLLSMSSLSTLFPSSIFP